jgi:HAD superfamily hydrolase (TIGR01549 family)
MKSIRTVFLDAGGVLVWPNWDRVASALRAHGVDVDGQRLRDADPRARYVLDQAHVMSDQHRSKSFFELVLAECNIEPSDATTTALDEMRAYQREKNLWEIVPDFVVPAVNEMRAAGYKLVVVSNANGTLHQLLTRLELVSLFDVILDSAVEGVEKPDKRYFDLALARSASEAASTIHVGDLYNVDVRGARGAGLEAVLVDEADLYRDADVPRIRSIAELPALLLRRGT